LKSQNAINKNIPTANEISPAVNNVGYKGAAIVPVTEAKK
jgi:hypothetical protein